ncbi:unnamed protein product [Dovyalis caffra]|uniref:Uncharacterized protein n=1 Tax=Dovyalis caffra TaxID=77055 RepID=A0AAV1RAA7_9ROSI|nr:unnamed protein product [Dovyalis caffra]
MAEDMLSPFDKLALDTTDHAVTRSMLLLSQLKSMLIATYTSGQVGRSICSGLAYYVTNNAGSQRVQQSCGFSKGCIFFKQSYHFIEPKNEIIPELISGRIFGLD